MLQHKKWPKVNLHFGVHFEKTIFLHFYIRCLGKKFFPVWKMKYNNDWWDHNGLDIGSCHPYLPTYLRLSLFHSLRHIRVGLPISLHLHLHLHTQSLAVWPNLTKFATLTENKKSFAHLLLFFLAKLWPLLSNFKRYWANFHYCKKPNIE